MARKKKIDARQAAKVVQAIHDVLYLDVDSRSQYYNGAKEWNIEMLETIAEVVGMLIPRPADVETCDECGNAIPAVANGKLANRHHDQSCSLYEASQN